MSSPEIEFLEDFVKTISGWEEKIFIGGGFALFVYREYFSKKGKIPEPVGTRDLDTLIPRDIVLEGKTKKLSQILIDGGFEIKFKDCGNPATEAYVKNISGVEFEVEFLTDNRVRKARSKNVEIAGVSAQALSYLEMSFSNHWPFNISSGELCLVVSPGTWVFHKLLTFPRRNSSAKALKDLYGVWYVSHQLEEVSKLAMIELGELRKTHRVWSKRVSSNLRKWLKDLTPELCESLRGQDSDGNLDVDVFLKWLKDQIY